MAHDSDCVATAALALLSARVGAILVAWKRDQLSGRWRAARCRGRVIGFARAACADLWRCE